MTSTQRFVTAALIGVLLGAPAPSADGETAPHRRAIEELLDRRATAVLRGDKAMFMSTVARLSPSFRRRQARLFDRMTRVPLESYELSVAWQRFGDLATQRHRRSYPTVDRVVIPVTEERYRLAGFDRHEAVEDVFYTYVLQEGEWLIAEDTDTDYLTLYSARHPWDLSSLRFAERDRFLLVTPKCETSVRCGRAPRGTLSLAAAAARRVERYWSPPWPRRLALVVPRSARDLRRMLQLTFDVDNFVAFAYSTVDLARGLRFTGHRVLLNPNAFVGRASDSTLDILAHEIVHVATRPLSGPFVPAFVEEGIAEYVRHEGNAGPLAFVQAQANDGRFDRRLPEDYEFTAGRGIDILRSYQESYSAVRYFIRRWGMRTFTRFYRVLGQRRIAPGTVDYHVDRAMRRTIGLGLDDFQRAWASSIISS
jgi:hypothetical protein